MSVLYENLFKRGNNNNIFMSVRKFVGVDKDSKRYLMRVGRSHRSRRNLCSLARVIRFFFLKLYFIL